MPQEINRFITYTLLPKELTNMPQLHVKSGKDKHGLERATHMNI